MTKIKKPTKAEWIRAKAMTDDQVQEAAGSDLDAKPTTPGQLAKFRRPSLAARVRRQLRLTQQEFADRFAIPVGTIRDWEQARTDPDAAATALLNAIAANPDQVAQAQRTDAPPAVTSKAARKVWSSATVGSARAAARSALSKIKDKAGAGAAKKLAASALTQRPRGKGSAPPRDRSKTPKRSA